MDKIPDRVAASLERLITAARRLEQAHTKITPEEVQLLGECSSRIRMGHRGQVIPYPKPQETTNSQGEPPILSRIRSRV